MLGNAGKRNHCQTSLSVLRLASKADRSHGILPFSESASAIFRVENESFKAAFPWRAWLKLAVNKASALKEAVATFTESIVMARG